jgi:hypothetical protein
MDLGNRVVSRICQRQVSNPSSGTRLLRDRRDLDFFQLFSRFSLGGFSRRRYSQPGVSIVNPTTPHQSPLIRCGGQAPHSAAKFGGAVAYKTVRPDRGLLDSLLRTLFATSRDPGHYPG